LLEEDFNRPSASVEVGHALRAPVHVILNSAVRN
jgi:hypothetical protein